MPGTTIDRQCGSSQQALHFAAAGVIAGHYDVVVAGGVESMSRIPMFSNGKGGDGPFGPMMIDRYDGKLVNQGVSAEMIAEKWTCRAYLDEMAVSPTSGRPGRPPTGCSPRRSWRSLGDRRPGIRPGPRWRSWPGCRRPSWKVAW